MSDYIFLMFYYMGKILDVVWTIQTYPFVILDKILDSYKEWQCKHCDATECTYCYNNNRFKYRR